MQTKNVDKGGADSLVQSTLGHDGDEILFVSDRYMGNRMHLRLIISEKTFIFRRWALDWTNFQNILNYGIPDQIVMANNVKSPRLFIKIPEMEEAIAKKYYKKHSWSGNRLAIKNADIWPLETSNCFTSSQSSLSILIYNFKLLRIIIIS